MICCGNRKICCILLEIFPKIITKKFIIRIKNYTYIKNFLQSFLFENVSLNILRFCFFFSIPINMVKIIYGSKQKNGLSFPGYLQILYIYDDSTCRMPVHVCTLKKYRYPEASWFRISSIKNFVNISSLKHCC